MFLVDSRFDLRNESRHHAALDRVISSVLSADLPEREKQLQYEQALSLSNKFDKYRSNSERTGKGVTDCRGEECQGQDYRNSCDRR